MKSIKTILNEILENLKQNKQIYTFQEGCNYCGISASSMYKYTAANKVPHYKPEGKLIFFKREDLDTFMLRNRQATMEELEEKASSYSLNRKNSRR
jgi:excisionase family DNA binding protein